MKFSGRRSPKAFSLALLLGGVAAKVPAQILGPEFQVNTYTSYAQRHPDVAADAAGNFVIAWDSYYQDGHECDGGYYDRCVGIVARRFGANGEPLTGEILVNTFTTGIQTDPAVASDAQGNFLVVWTSIEWGGQVKGRFFDFGGQAFGDEFHVNQTGYAGFVDAAASPAGRFVVVWSRHAGPNRGIWGRRYGAGGLPLGNEFLIKWSSYAQLSPDVAMWADGSSVVTWWNEEVPGVVGVGLDPDGQVATDEFAVDSHPEWTESAVARRSPGDFVVVGGKYWHFGPDPGIWGRSFGVEGAGPTFEIAPGSTTHPTEKPHVAAAESGGFLVVWEAGNMGEPYMGVRARRYGADAAPLGPDFRVNAYTYYTQEDAAVASLGGGDFVVTWLSQQDGPGVDRPGIYARLVSYAIFRDGFETGDACGWSGTVGGGCP